MFLGLSATSSTIGLAVTFFVIFPALAHVLIGFAAVQVMGEKAENDRYREGHSDGA